MSVVVNRIQLNHVIDDDVLLAVRRDLARGSQIALARCAIQAADWVPRTYVRHRPPDAEIET